MNKEHKEHTAEEERIVHALLNRSTPEDSEKLLATLPEDELRQYRAMEEAGLLFDEMCAEMMAQLAQEDEVQVIPFPGHELSDDDLNLLAAAGKHGKADWNKENKNFETNAGARRPQD